jgi:Multiubiquitin
MNGENDLEVAEAGNTVTIVVDGTPHQVPKKEKITYAEVVTLAYPDYPNHPEITYSVTYERGHGDKPDGILPPGGSVKVKEGMSFCVNRTGQS